MDAQRCDQLIEAALAEASAAPAHGDVPVGAVVARVTNGEIVSRAHNERERLADPTAHAEILALRAAAADHGSWRLDQYVLAVTLEPCAMCAGAAINARVATIVFGAPDPKAGAVGSLYNLAVDPRLNHQAEVLGGIRSQECGEVLRAFFADRRPPADR